MLAGQAGQVRTPARRSDHDGSQDSAGGIYYRPWTLANITTAALLHKNSFTMFIFSLDLGLDKTVRTSLKTT